MSQLYSLLKNGELRYVDLALGIIDETRRLFVNAANDLMNDETERIEFEGQYIIRDSDNEISYIEMELPEAFNDIPNNQQGITTLDMDNDSIKSIFWYEEGTFLFQVFSSGNLLENKYVVRFFQEQHNYTKMTDKAFIINNKIQAIYKEGRLFFKSFPSVSKIFDLTGKMLEATNEEVSEFGNKDNIIIDTTWLLANANTKTRRLIKMVKESGTLDTFMSMDSRKRKKIANSVNIEINIVDGNLVLPSNVVKVNKVLEFLNEDVYKGLITSHVFKTNSKRLG